MSGTIERLQKQMAASYEASRRRGRITPLGVLFVAGVVFTAAGVGITALVIFVHRTEPKNVAAAWGLGIMAAACLGVGIGCLVTGIMGLVRRLRWRTARSRFPDEPWWWDYRWDPSGCADSRRVKAASWWAKVITLAIVLPLVHLAAIVVFVWFPWTRFMIFFAVLFLGVWDLAFFTALWNARRASAERDRFGAAMLRFARFPFFLGETCEMKLENEKGLGHFQRMTFTLQCVNEHRVVVGTRSRSTRLDADRRWSEERTVDAPAELPPGVPLPIEFQLPDDPTLATRLADDQPQYWELLAAAQTDGLEYRERFLVPVYARPPGGAAAAQ